MLKRKVQSPHGPWSESSEEDAATADGAMVAAAVDWDSESCDSDPCGTSNSSTAPTGIVDLTVPAVELVCAAAPRDDILEASRTAIAECLIKQCVCRRDSTCFQKCDVEDMIKLRALYQTLPRDSQRALVSSAPLNIKT